MAHKIAQVLPGSIAQQCGLKPGDRLISINGTPVLDQIDYQALTAQEAITLAIDTGDGIDEIQLQKDEGEPLGIVFESTLMSRPRVCANDCVFCFIEQMPSGMRNTLYVKDDDWRLSLMMGNFITLTNVSETEFDRIIQRHASPLYISVHATDGEVRAQLMGNPKARGIMAQLHRLADAGIAFHCQVVLCPGLNDGAVLDRTIGDLADLYPAARSVALVPVGLTAYRQNLFPLEGYTAQTARTVLAQAEGWQRQLLDRIGTRFVFAADEFYCLGGQEIPEDAAYEGYPQIENGVGLLRSFDVEFQTARRFAGTEDAIPRSVVIATGVSAAPFLRSLVEQAALPGVSVRVLPVDNNFFGWTVTVAGLLTGHDLLAALQGVEADEILISQAMLRQEDALFLDGLSLGEVEEALRTQVHPVACDGAAFYGALEGEQYLAEA